MAEAHTPGTAAERMGVPDALLATKLHIPPARPHLVARHRLLARLQQGLSGKLTLVSAPAGFGKTTFVAAWARHAATPVGWVSLDRGDNDPVRFWRYLITALSGLRSGLGEHSLSLLGAPQPPPIEAVLTRLINDLAALPDERVLVLDDYHLIETRPIHDGLSYLIERMPPTLHLVIATRADPPLSLARLRARGDLAEVHASDLRFTSDEAATFLDRVMGIALSPHDVEVLGERTEGWVVGLQLAALSMRGREDRAAFIEAFTGSNRFVLDYLVDEVLARQPPDVQAFLLRTSILDRMCGSLCDALADPRVQGRDGQALLQILDESNLFVIPLDAERRWYRYHQLFATVLRQRRAQVHRDLDSALHRRAAEWYAQHGLIAEAVEHALAGHDFGRAAALLEPIADALWSRGEVETLLRWLDTLPDDYVRARPRLYIHHAKMLLLGAQVEAAEARLAAAEAAVVQQAADTGGWGGVTNTLLGEIAAMRATIAGGVRWDVPRTIALCQRALAYLPDERLSLRALVMRSLGNAYQLRGETGAAARAYTEAAMMAQPAGDLVVTLLALTDLADLQLLQGHLHRAAESYQRALQLADEAESPGSPAAGYAHVRVSRLLLEWNDREEAAKHVATGIEQGTRGANADLLLGGYTALAGVEQARGNAERARAALREAEQLVRQWNLPRWMVRLGGLRARLQLAQGDIDAAVRWVGEAGLRTDDDVTYPRSAEYVAMARVLLAQGRENPAGHHLREALTLLGRLHKTAEGIGHVGSVIEALVLKALALQAGGQETEALEALELALALAEPEGYVRSFVNEGEPMAVLLRKLLETRREQRRADPQYRTLLAYARRLLASFESFQPVAQPMARARRASGNAQPLVEPLTDREREVLTLLAAGLSNREIAERTVTAVSTVKWHINSIYGKLGVASRTQAIARARALDLIPA